MAKKSQTFPELLNAAIDRLRSEDKRLNEIVKMLGTSTGTLYQIRNGVKYPDLALRMKFAKALGEDVQLFVAAPAGKRTYSRGKPKSDYRRAPPTEVSTVEQSFTIDDLTYLANALPRIPDLIEPVSISFLRQLLAARQRKT